MKLLNWKYLICVAVAVMISAAIGMRGTDPIWQKHAGAVSNVICALFGVGVGTGVFCMLRWWIHVWPLRIISAVISGTLGVVVGLISGFLISCNIWEILVFHPHPADYTGDMVYQFIVLYSILVTAPVAFVFGFGPGLSVTEDIRETNDQHN